AAASGLSSDSDQASLHLPITAKGFDFALGLVLFGRRGEAFGDGLAIHLVGQSRMGTVTGVAWTVTMATRITTATTGSSDRPGAKIFQLRNLPQDSGALLFQIGDRLRHKGPPNNRAYHIRSVIGAKKRNLPKSYFHVAHPTGIRRCRRPGCHQEPYPAHHS